jgi:phospholipid-transporting ATPase
MAPITGGKAAVILDRSIRFKNVHVDENNFRHNVVRTARYTAMTFLPLNFYEQFHIMSNVYFLAVGALQLWPAVSTSQGVPTQWIPLAFILMVSALRAGVEDYARHKEDHKEAATEYLVFSASKKEFEVRASGRIHVGDIVKVKSNQQFPADLCFLNSSNSRGHCFVETSNLDGETNLKVKTALSAHQAWYINDKRISHMTGAMVGSERVCEGV